MKLALSLRLKLWWACNGEVFLVDENTNLNKCSKELQSYMRNFQTPQAAGVSVSCDKEFILSDIDSEPCDESSCKYAFVPFLTTILTKDQYRICDKLTGTDWQSKKALDRFKKSNQLNTYSHISQGEACLT